MDSSGFREEECFVPDRSSCGAPWGYDPPSARVVPSGVSRNHLARACSFIVLWPGGARLPFTQAFPAGARSCAVGPSAYAGQRLLWVWILRRPGALERLTGPT